MVGNIIISIIIFAVCLAVAIFAEASFAKGQPGQLFDTDYFVKGVLWAGVYSLANAATYLLAKIWPTWGICFAVIAILSFIYIVVRAVVDANEWKEIIPLLILTAITTAVIFIAVKGSYGVFTVVILMIPFVLGAFVLLAVLCYGIKKMGGISNVALPLWIAVIVLSLVLLAGLLVPLGIKGGKMLAEKLSAKQSASTEEITDSVDDKGPITTEPEPEPVVEPEPEVVEPWYHFFNLDLQDDEDEYNDFNFGPDPYSIETDVEKDAKWMDAEFRRRLRLDPDLLSADAAYNDSIVGTRYMGEFYDTAKQDWSKAMNDAVDAWMLDEEDFHLSEKLFEEWLDKAVRVEIWTPKEYKMTITDMMYMDPIVKRLDSINKEPIPDIIAMETNNQEGNLLVYVFLIKGKEFYVPYRIQCGFQGVNVVKVMKITPTKPKKPTEPDKPKDPDKPKKPVKDPTQGTQGDPVAPNDDPGPGPDTNNPENPTVSTQDENPTPNPDPNKDWDELDDINKPKPVEPVTPDPVPNVDDNEDDLNKPQPTPDPAVTDDGDKPIVNNPDNPVGEWEGPKD